MRCEGVLESLQTYTHRKYHLFTPPLDHAPTPTPDPATARTCESIAMIFLTGWSWPTGKKTPRIRDWP